MRVGGEGIPAAWLVAGLASLLAVPVAAADGALPADTPIPPDILAQIVGPLPPYIGEALALAEEVAQPVVEAAQAVTEEAAGSDPEALLSDLPATPILPFEGAYPSPEEPLPPEPAEPAEGDEAESVAGTLVDLLFLTPSDNGAPAADVPLPEESATHQKAFRKPLLLPVLFDPDLVATPVPVLEAPLPVEKLSGRPAPEVAPASSGGASVFEMPGDGKGWLIGIAAGLGTLALLLRLTGLLPLLTRVPREKVAEHPVRARMLEAIQAHPGIHFNQLVLEMDLGRGQAEHHLRALIQAGHVVRHSGGKYACLFLANHGVVAVARHAHLLRSERAWRLLAAVCASPGITVAAAESSIAGRPGSLAYHLRRLAEAGFLRIDDALGRTLWPTAQAYVAVQHLGGPTPAARAPATSYTPSVSAPASG